MKPLEENNFKNANISNMYNNNNNTVIGSNSTNGPTNKHPQKNYSPMETLTSPVSSTNTIHSFECYPTNSNAFNFISKENNNSSSYFNCLTSIDPQTSNNSSYENGPRLPITHSTSNLISGAYIPPPSLSSFVQNNYTTNKKNKKLAKETSKPFLAEITGP
jgi:hypothetical protein